MSSTVVSQATELQLKQLFDECSKTIAQANTIQEGILEELTKRHTEKFKAQLAAKGKEGGSITDEINGVDIEFKIDKKVTWDQVKLRNYLSVRPDLIDKVIKAKFEVSEKIFDGLTEGDVIKEIKAARTVEWKPAKISFKKE